jgi:hypothetical protein
MDSERAAGQVSDNNSQRSRPRNRWWHCVQADINRRKIKNWKEKQKTELTGRSPVRGRRLALDCSAIEEEDEEAGGDSPNRKQKNRITFTAK